MILIILIFLLIFFKRKILEMLFEKLSKRNYLFSFMYFYIRSMNENKLKISIYMLINEFVNLVIFSFISATITELFFNDKAIGFVFGILIIFFKGVAVIKRVEEGKAILLEELNSFLFVYEMEQITGSNILNTITFASDSIGYVEVKNSVEEYILEFEKLFILTKWIVIKRIIILIQKNINFTGKDMNILFLDVSDELSKKYYEKKKMDYEKKENLMLIPMSINLVLMILYLISPFVLNFFRR